MEKPTINNDDTLSVNVNLLNSFYNELLERMEVLESKKKSKLTEGRILELQLVIVRIQQIILNNLDIIKK